ncbi:putative nicotinate-nucleotide adenylyltransferase [Candidatus Izimaplasma bacterium HR1]|jgi:nicotinate-nucleotide adenylyltransferase|uniref:nicotinate (nicotinamide) nucleotide adenylyltransferase n=1 Tax=Candidatus Izimoplasma sp. HR1 TaxID=1541959 RepID=UPI0004F5DD11|nr:putative nicotinate-nucleotide adenylyltransferase [Candidatus Izimaplasma bacterium HR1]
MIVVFGGAFNPVTNAHEEVYKYVNNKFDDVKFIFLPVSSAYTKSDLASNYDRLNMLDIAMEKYNNVTVSDLEISDSDFLGTYQSLIRLVDFYEEELAFVVGADNLYGMEDWINIEGILSEFKIIVLGRDGIEPKIVINSNKLLKRFEHSFIIFEDFNVNVSSTGFRETFDESLVPKEVFEYIIENELYRGDDDDV